MQRTDARARVSYTLNVRTAGSMLPPEGLTRTQRRKIPVWVRPSSGPLPRMETERARRKKKKKEYNSR